MSLALLVSCLVLSQCESRYGIKINSLAVALLPLRLFGPGERCEVREFGTCCLGFVVVGSGLVDVGCWLSVVAAGTSEVALFAAIPLRLSLAIETSESVELSLAIDDSDEDSDEESRLLDGVSECCCCCCCCSACFCYERCWLGCFRLCAGHNQY